MTTTLYTASSIQKAETAADLTNALAFRQLTLRNTRWVGSLSVADRILSGSLSRTIEGASTLQLTLDDPGFELLNSPVFDFRDDGRLDAIDILVDTLGFRVVKVEPTLDATTQNVALTFEEREVTLLRAHDMPISVPRSAQWTRARFVRLKLVNEVRAEQIPMISPEEFEVQAIDQPKEWKAAAKGQAPSAGFDASAKVTIEGVDADPAQRDNLRIALQVADVHKAPQLAYLAMVCAGIGESGFRVVKNPASVYAGVFQADPKNIPMTDTAEQARCFLQGGKGFQGGGAIAIARAHPDWTPGHIAYVVEGDRSNFSSDAAAAKFYDDHRADAEAIVTAWSGTGGSSGSTGTRTTVKQYRFTRGLPGKRETSWDAMQRLAAEVGWRCYVVGGIVYFVSEEWLFMQQALTEIGPDTPGLLGLKGDWDEGKTEQQVTLTIDANRWEYPPGSIIALRGLGPCTGRWLVHTIDRPDIFDTTTEITLTKPLPRKREPAPTLINVARKPAADAAQKVQDVLHAANAISRQNLPYVWGGGHAVAGTPDRGQGAGGIGYDCSGSVAAALLGGGILPDAWKNGVPASGTFAASWGDAGQGRQMTVWANTDHVWIEFDLPGIGYRRFDTSPQGDGPNGPQVRKSQRSTAGFTARHFPGT